jgi:hypothetical protein
MSLKKIARPAAVVIGILVLLALLAQVFAALYLRDKISHLLKDKIYTESQGKYRVTLGDASVSIFGRSLTLKKFELLPTGRIRNTDAAVSMVADEIRLDGIHLISFLSNEELEINEITFVRPIILLFHAEKELREDSAEIKQTLFSVIGGELNSVSVEKISIQDALFKIYKRGEREAVLVSDKNNIELSTFMVNARVDSLRRHFLTEKFSIRMNSCIYRPPGGLYFLKGRNLFASYHDSILRIDSLQLVPKFTKQEFGKKAGQQVSRVNLKMQDILFSSMNVQMFVERNWLVAEKLSVGKLDINVHRDKNMELAKTVKPSLQRIIFNIPFRTRIDSISVKQSDIVYEHFAENTKEPGKISFKELQANITGFNNDTSSKKNNGILTMKISCSFMGKGRLAGRYDFPLTTDKEHFKCSGALTSFPLTEVNKMLENTMYISIRKGIADSLLFSFKADEKSSNGTMKFLYHDLKLDILDKRNNREKGKRRFLSFIANTFVVKDGNPDKDGNVRMTSIHYDRYPYKYFFYYTWKSLQSGIMPAIGLHSETLLKRSDDK